MSRIGSVFLSVPLFLLAGFCVFGFLASFEPTDYNLVFRVGYPIVGVASVAAALWLLFRKRHAP